jgi:UDP-glucose 4-epimerase
MNFLITGGCGFIGANLTRRLLADGHSIRIADNLSVGRIEDLPETPVRPTALDGNWSKLEFVQADILDAEAMVEVAQGAQAVIHLAANTGVLPSIEAPRKDCETNVLGALNVLEACRAAKVGRFVLASSGAPIGNVEPPIHEEMAPHPMSPYGASKLAGEAYCSAYWHSFGLETVALRFGNVYGPGSSHKGSVVARFIRRAMAGEELEIFGDGSQTRDFIFVGDLLDAISAAATRPGVGGEVIQVAAGRERTVGELADVLVGQLESRLGRTVAVVSKDERAGEMRRNWSDISKARRLLDYEPKTPLEKGLRLTIDYFVALSH